MLFPCRPTPVPGEALTSYLMRLTSDNRNDITQLIKRLDRHYAATNTYGWLSNIDKFGSKILDVARLIEWGDVPVRTVDDMTFIHVWRKFGIDYHRTDTAYKFVSRSLVYKHRRFCPICLKETGAYHLVWQIREIDVCDIHRIKLRSKCSTCNMDQPYTSPTLGIHLCTYCKKDLVVSESEEVTWSHTLDEQQRRYDEWRFLLSRDGHSVPPRIPGLTQFQSLIVGLRYIAQNSFYKVMPTRYVQAARRASTPGDGIEGLPSLGRILQICRTSGTPIQQLRLVVPPTSFTRMVLTPEAAYNCQTPWCKSIDSDASIVRKLHNRRVNKTGTYYNSVSMCLDCGIQYGIDQHDGTWKPVGDSLLRIQRIKELLEQGLSRTEAAHVMGVGNFTVFQIAGYLAFHNLVRAELAKEFMAPSVNTDCLVKKFKQVSEMNANFYTDGSHRQFGWTRTEYCYYLANPEVQRFLFCEVKKKHRFAAPRKVTHSRDYVRQRVESAIPELMALDITLSSKNVEKHAGLYSRSIYRHGLTSLVTEAYRKQRSLRQNAKNSTTSASSTKGRRKEKLGGMLGRAEMDSAMLEASATLQYEQ